MWAGNLTRLSQSLGEWPVCLARGARTEFVVQFVSGTVCAGVPLSFVLWLQMLMSGSCYSPVILLYIVWTAILRLSGPCSATLAQRPWMQRLATGQQHPMGQSVSACFHVLGVCQDLPVTKRMWPAWHFKRLFLRMDIHLYKSYKIHLRNRNRKCASHFFRPDGL